MRAEGEAICLHRFQDADGVAIFEITRTVETVRVSFHILYHNDVLAVPEQDNIVALIGYSSRHLPLCRVDKLALIPE